MNKALVLVDPVASGRQKSKNSSAFAHQSGLEGNRGVDDAP
jgi:hypothetical protein